MTTIEFKAELHRIQERAEKADKMAADFVVVVACNVAILGIAIICVEVLL